MKTESVSEQLNALRYTRTELESTIAQKKGTLSVLKKQHQDLRTSSKSKFGVDSIEELRRVIEEGEASFKSRLTILQKALEAYKQGEFEKVKQLLETVT